jgi:hypothetical protein
MNNIIELVGGCEVTKQDEDDGAMHYVVYYTNKNIVINHFLSTNNILIKYSDDTMYFIHEKSGKLYRSIKDTLCMWNCYDKMNEDVPDGCQKFTETVGLWYVMQYCVRVANEVEKRKVEQYIRILPNRNPDSPSITYSYGFGVMTIEN